MWIIQFQNIHIQKLRSQHVNLYQPFHKFSRIHLLHKSFRLLCLCFIREQNLQNIHPIIRTPCKTSFENTLIVLCQSPFQIHRLAHIVVIHFLAVDNIQVMHKKSPFCGALWELLGSQRCFAAVTPLVILKSDSQPLTFLYQPFHKFS